MEISNPRVNTKMTNCMEIIRLFIKVDKSLNKVIILMVSRRVNGKHSIMMEQCCLKQTTKKESKLENPSNFFSLKHSILDLKMVLSK